jgi:hypothetical protein
MESAAYYLGRGVIRMRWLFCVPAMVTIALSACAVVPPLREDAISISAIVQRVKCEVAMAVPEPEPPFPTGRYQWMADWTAKVDLTLITNDQSAVTPSATFINPLATQVVPLVGSVSRNFSFGVGAGVTNNAIRNETMSFTVSVQELRNLKYRGDCALPDGLDLYGNLGLKEWVAAALGPVDREMLTIGKHTAPNAKPAAQPQFATAELSHVEQIHQAAIYAKEFAAKAAASVQRARDIAARYFVDAKQSAPLVTRNDMQAVYRQVEDVLTQAKQSTAWSQKAAAVEKLLTPDEKKNLTPAQLQDIADAKAAGQNADAAKIAANAIWKSIPQDSPIDSIGHQVQFIVVATGNATPNWTLVHFKGPGSSGNFASLTDTRTHTLNIAMGAPSGAVNASPEQERMLNNLQLDTLRLPPSF